MHQHCYFSSYSLLVVVLLLLVWLGGTLPTTWVSLLLCLLKPVHLLLLLLCLLLRSCELLLRLHHKVGGGLERYLLHLLLLRLISTWFLVELLWLRWLGLWRSLALSTLVHIVVTIWVATHFLADRRRAQLRHRTLLRQAARRLLAAASTLCTVVLELLERLAWWLQLARLLLLTIIAVGLTIGWLSKDLLLLLLLAELLRLRFV